MVGIEEIIYWKIGSCVSLLCFRGFGAIGIATIGIAMYFYLGDVVGRSTLGKEVTIERRDSL